jgi:hypothetical protein
MLNGSDFVVFANGFPALDVDATGLHRFRQLKLKFDLKQAIVEVSAFHLNVVSEIEAALKRATLNAAIKVFTFIIALIRSSRNNQHVLIESYVYLIWPKASDRQCDAIGVFAGSRDVTGRVIVLRYIPKALVYQIEESVKADACSPKRIEVQGPHSHILR